MQEISDAVANISDAPEAEETPSDMDPVSDAPDVQFEDETSDPDDILPDDPVLENPTIPEEIAPDLTVATVNEADGEQTDTTDGNQADVFPETANTLFSEDLADTEPLPEETSVSDKLRRIRAVVARNAHELPTGEGSQFQPAPQVSDDDLDTHDDFETDDSLSLTDMLEGSARPHSETESGMVQDADVAGEPSDPETSALVLQPTANLPAPEDLPDAEMEDGAMSASDSAPATTDQATADTLKSLVAEINNDTEADQDDTVETVGTSPEVPEEAASDPDQSGDAAPHIQMDSPSPHIVKLQRAAQQMPEDTALAAEAENVSQDPLLPEPQTPAENIASSEEETDPSEMPDVDTDLENSLSAIFTESAEHHTSEPESDDVPEETQENIQIFPEENTDAPRRGRRNDRSVSRLLEETNTHLDSPDSQNRRSAISHLRAAVAATVADKRIRGAQQDTEDLEAYRADLASAVKPGSSLRKTRSNPPEKRDTETPPPLVLVSEQRIDPEPPVRRRNQPQTLIKHIMPRRIQRDTAALAIGEPLEEDRKSAFPASWQDFSAFAKDKGARSQADYIEAAAAWLTWIEEQPHFTRLKVINLVTETLGEQQFNRDTGLHSFGNLIREQVLVKEQRGQFSISPKTRFHP